MFENLQTVLIKDSGTC